MSLSLLHFLFSLAKMKTIDFHTVLQFKFCSKVVPQFSFTLYTRRGHYVCVYVIFNGLILFFFFVPLFSFCRWWWSQEQLVIRRFISRNEHYSFDECSLFEWTSTFSIYLLLPRSRKCQLLRWMAHWQSRVQMPPNYKVCVCTKVTLASC